MKTDDVIMDVLVGARHIDETFVLEKKKPFKKQSGIYCLISEDKIVYVGQSTDIMSRIAIHTKTKEFDSYTTLSCPLPWRNTLEAHLIVCFNPQHNETLPVNPLYQMLKRIQSNIDQSDIPYKDRTDIRKLKKYIKAWGVKKAWGEYFCTLDFDNFGEEW